MTTGRSNVRGSDITAALRRVGIGPGDVVFAHSSLSAFGHVEGGADAVIDALLDAVGGNGTVVLPAFTWGRYHAVVEPVVFDTAREPVKDEFGLIGFSFVFSPVSLC